MRWLDYIRRWPRGKLRKIMVGTVGGVMLLAGLAMLVLPGPAIIVIPLALAILATEFRWAARIRDRVKLMLKRRKAAKASRGKSARTTLPDQS